MNAPMRQDSRVGRLTTEYGKDVLVLLRLSGTDGMNQLFQYDIEALSSTQGLDFDALIGTHASVEIDSPQHGAQPFDGIVTDATWSGVGETGQRYSLTLRPWFWLAGKRRNQRIFHEKTVVEILEELLQPYASLGDPHLENRLQNDYRQLEYTVQYRESDLDFALRLMERFGISYHFTHKVGSHTLVLTDVIESHEAVPGGTRDYLGVDGHHFANEEHFWEWSASRRLNTGAIRLTDWNFKTPTVAMEVDKLGDAAHEQGQIESYDFPGDYLDPGAGKDVVALRVDQERAQDARLQGTGDCTSLKAGLTLELGGEELPGVTGEKYLCLKARHSFVSEAYGTGASDSDGYAYSGQYTFAPISAPMVPERVTARPIVHGPQTAVVVGEGEIDCDEYGRILVHFPWDLAKAYSMRCRVSQNWASKGWGGMVIPRIGMEVVVEFIEGDPDMPLVTGCVYNGKNDVPYPLPEHKTKSVFRSDTHQGEGFNEFTFEDEKGREMISLHAQKDQTLKVLNNRTKRVDNDQIESVGRNKDISVGKNHQENIGGSMNLSVGSGGFGQFLNLAGIAAAGAKDALAGSEAVGDSGIASFVGNIAKVGAMVEGLTSRAAGAVADAGNHRSIAGLMQAATGSGLGQLLSTTMPISGVMNTVVEKFQSDTIGLARTEQIGAFKNTSVGHTYSIHTGTEFMINCGKSKFIMDSDGNVTIIGTKFNFSASGHVQINGKVIDLN